MPAYSPTSVASQPLLESEREEHIEELAHAVCARRLVAPAIFLLEMYRPLTRTLYAVSVASLPLFVPVFGTRLARRALAVLESPEHVGALIDAIERRENKLSVRSKGGGS